MSRIRADQLVNRVGSGGPKFPNGVAEGFSVSGVVTATSYRGDGSQLTGIDASSLKDGNNVKVQATASGATVTGDISATNATFSGNLTVQGTTSTIDTIVTSVDSLAVDGNVGIGTDNPAGTLEIDAASTTDMIMLDASGTNFARIGHNFSSGTAVLDVRSEGHTRFLTNGNNEQLRITSGGNIGIGLTNPGAPLHLSGPAEIRLNNAIDAGNFARIRCFEESGDNGAHLAFNTGAGEVVRFQNNGNVGINSTSPSGKLDIGGNVFPAADNTHDLGSASKRWANIYTGDLNLSNEGSANDVDGTWGQYTIQEGEDDLFLINRRTGKKYKFNLTEVN